MAVTSFDDDVPPPPLVPLLLLADPDDAHPLIAMAATANAAHRLRLALILTAYPPLPEI
jgi:hypothetical protein